VGCLVAKLGTRRGCRPGESAHPSKRRRSLRECSAARQEAVSGGGAGRSVRPFAGAHVGPSRGHSKRHGLLRSSAGVRRVVPGSGVRSASLGTTLPCSGRAPAVCKHDAEIHDFQSSTGATARAAEGTVRPRKQCMRRERWRVILAGEVALSIFLAPFVVVVMGLELGGRLADPQLSMLAVLGLSFVVGLVMFGWAFVLAGLACASIVMLVGRRSLPVEVVAAVGPPVILFPVAAVTALVLRSRGYIPLIQDARPYVKAAVVAGFAVGLTTLLIARAQRATQS
jgi:hypothetical protein